MIPRVSKPGHSFKGAALYYLHDKKAKTKDRVAWTHINNIPTDNPDKAFNWMAYTAMNAHYLKQDAGVTRSGRKRTTGPVYSFSLAWSPEQTPEKQTMLDAAHTVLKFLELSEHESVFVAHRDTAHPHVHVICNLIHPQTGRKASISYDWITMSQWAEALEGQDGQILCEQRVINNEQRRLSRQYNKMLGMVKHREKKLDIAPRVQQLYEQSDNGASFKAALQEAGYTLATGDRRGYVLVDQAGDIYSLSRQLKGQRAGDIQNRLQGLKDLPLANEIVHQRKHFDRDQYETERQQKIVDAAIAEEKKKRATARQQSKIPPPQHNPDSEHLRKLDEQRAWEQKTDRQKDRLKEQQQAFYKRDDLLKAIAQKEQQATGSPAKEKQRLANLKALQKTLADMDRRMQEQEQKLNRQSEASNPNLSKEEQIKKRAEELRQEMQKRRDKGRGPEP